MRSSLQKNTLLNIAGALIPILISLVTVPLYLSLIGEARYGILAIIWLLLGYYGVFTLGFGRAIANQVAKMPEGSHEELNNLFWTALLTITIVGLIGGVTLFMVGSVYFDQSIKMPVDLRPEVIIALPWLILAVPVNTASAVLIGALEGRERFGVVNIIGVSSVALSQLVPLLIALTWGAHLSGLVGAVTISQLLGAIILFTACIKLIPILGQPVLKLTYVKRLFNYGGWVTITTVVSPLLTIIDQFIISTKLGVTVLPVYNIPYNLVTRLSILPLGLSRSLFPRFSMLQKEAAQSLSYPVSLTLAAIMTPAITLSLIILRPFLNLWIGSDLAQDAAPVGEILLIGIWVNGMANIPYIFLQGQGRPDLPAKFHLIELPIYITILISAIAVWGVIGAAWSWTIRVFIDMCLLFFATRISKKVFMQLGLGFGITVLTCFSALTVFPAMPNARFLFGILLSAISILWAWFILPEIVRQQIIIQSRRVWTRNKDLGHQKHP